MNIPNYILEVFPDASYEYGEWDLEDDSIDLNDEFYIQVGNTDTYYIPVRKAGSDHVYGTQFDNLETAFKKIVEWKNMLDGT